jgi:hypothetical protein
MENNNEKKSKQLGMPIGTASNRLRKLIMFDLLKRLNLNVCFQCEEEIKDVENLSIEHKIPWLGSENPTNLFFDLSNIAFSHLSCNVGMARRDRNAKHGGHTKYNSGCRCDLCKAENARLVRNWREKKRTSSSIG